MKPEVFAQVVLGKPVFLTEHAKEQMEVRNLSVAGLRNDLERPPSAIEEQACETEGERKFLVYYPQSGPHFHAYVFITDGEVRVITAWRTNRLKQIDISNNRLKLFRKQR
ncbi:MAG: DUF4258 domain-containing protein [Candidatus Micrarchaeota archaeon]